MILISKKAVTPMLAIVVLLIITISVSGGAFFWLNKIQGEVAQEENLQVKAFGQDIPKVDVVASVYDSATNQLTLFLQNLGQAPIPLSTSASSPTTLWVVRDQQQSTICSTDWSGNDNGPVCVNGCGGSISSGEIMKVILKNVGPNTLCNLGAQSKGSLVTLTIDFSGRAIASGGIII